MCNKMENKGAVNYPAWSPYMLGHTRVDRLSILPVNIAAVVPYGYNPSRAVSLLRYCLKLFCVQNEHKRYFKTFDDLKAQGALVFFTACE